MLAKHILQAAAVATAASITAPKDVDINDASKADPTGPISESCCIMEANDHEQLPYAT